MDFYCIVKYAGEQKYWEIDPTTGVYGFASHHQSSIGKKLGIKPFYSSKSEAEKDCSRLLIENPVGRYGVCPILKLSSVSFIDTEELRVLSVNGNDYGKVIRSFIDENRKIIKDQPSVEIQWDHNGNTILPHCFCNEISVMGTDKILNKEQA